MELIQYPQEKSDRAIADKILALENTAWPGDDNERFPSAPDTYVTSFVLMEKEAAICHVGIRKSLLHHKGQTYAAYGLSEVVTHPAYRRQGLASNMIRKAAAYMAAQAADISLFTCEQSRVAFYTRGGWEPVKGACLVGGTRDRPFRSDSLNLVTMMRFLSEKGRSHKTDFENTAIVLELGEKQLW